MRVSVCELRNNQKGLLDDWTRLEDHLKTAKSDLLLLPEMAFSPWLAETNVVDAIKWAESVKSHEAWFNRLSELSVGTIVGTAPVIQNSKRHNEGFVWTAAEGYQAVHQKVNLPDEAGWWEATWYEKGPDSFKVAEVNGVRVGFLICSELWFNEHARTYMKQDVDILVTPRATPAASVEKWITAGKTAALVAGAFSLSSNFSPAEGSNIEWGGSGWIIEPDNSEVIARTSARDPFQTVDIDLEIARAAKSSYPRNVKE